MPKYIVRDTVACWVSWEYEVEAANEAEARERYYEGDYMPHGKDYNMQVGDSLDWADNNIEVLGTVPPPQKLSPKMKKLKIGRKK